MSQDIKYEIQRAPRSLSAVVRFIIIPFTILALLLVVLGVYTFTNANKIMRRDSKQLEDFANNILPTYSIASFQSLDGVTSLSGWYFPARTTPVSTVVFVHGQGGNRLQFDVDTANLYDFFVNKGFNVLSFDLRHAGKSKGNISTFGYAEWADVIAAISFVRKTSTTKNVILYGFGSGVSACLIAMEKLPLPAQSLDDFADNIAKLEFNRSYIRGLILDSPSLSSDDYIQEVCRSSVFLGKQIGQFSIPYAIRLSAGASKSTNLAAVIARTQLPVHLIYKKSSDNISDDKAYAFVSERQRLFPTLTTTYAMTATTPLSTFLFDTKSYMDSIDDFLTRYIN